MPAARPTGSPSREPRIPSETPRIVITGIGMVTAVGNDTATTWGALLEGRSGVGPVREFDTTDYDVKIAAEVKDFDPKLYLDAKEVRRNDRYVHYAVAATQQALEDARYTIPGDGEDVGVVIGSGAGGLTALSDQFRVLFDRGPDRVSPFLITQLVTDIAAGYVALRFGARGPNFATVSACATSANALGEAWEIIRRGDARAMIAGGSEFAPNQVSLAAFTNMHALSRRNDDPEHASRPFDAQRDGFVMGAGAGIVILERLDDALARKAPIYAEIIGYASTSDAHHITEPAPGGAGLARAIRKALKKADIAPERVDYVNAHGTSTKFNDRDETAALHAVFGDHARKLAVSSTKSMIGHTMGAAGAIETGVTALTLKHGIITPTTNYEHPDPECDLDYVPNQARKAEVRVAVSESMGFGGHNAVLVLQRYDG
ncbi:MAG TPA: beta-ketoacyl-ACP synthase II [Ktedonobacterales bacterium]|jgi:3-oxoacyl-[acyl-carrier-protein] synthase II